MLNRIAEAVSGRFLTGDLRGALQQEHRSDSEGKEPTGIVERIYVERERDEGSPQGDFVGDLLLRQAPRVAPVVLPSCPGTNRGDHAEGGFRPHLFG